MEKTTKLEPPRARSRDSSRPNSQQSTPSHSANRKALRSRRKSTGGKRSVYNSSDEDDALSEILDENGFPKDMDLEIHQFVYSSEVKTALERLRERRARRNKFKKSEVHIFHLPRIMTSGTLPFVPSASFVRSTETASLPEPKAVPRLPRIRNRRQRTLLLDQTLEDVQEEGRQRRKATPLSRSLTNSFIKTPRVTPRTTPKSTPRHTPKSQGNTPRLKGLTPKETSTVTPR